MGKEKELNEVEEGEKNDEDSTGVLVSKTEKGGRQDVGRRRRMTVISPSVICYGSGEGQWLS